MRNPARVASPGRPQDGTASGQPFRVGILGAGFIADFHARALASLPHVQLTTVCDADARRAAAFQRKWRLPYMTVSLPEMLDQAEVDVVHILLPPPLHASAARDCLEAGRAVFVEKPIAINSAECADLRAAALRSGGKIGVNHNAIYHPAFRRLVQLIQDWHLGEIQHVTTFWNVPLRQLQLKQYSGWLFASPGNVLLEQAVHPLSQVKYLLGGISTISALASGPVQLSNGRWLYDTWQMAMSCDRGTAQSFHSFEKGFHDCWLHVVGQDGAALVDLRRNTLRVSEKTRFSEPLDQLLDGLQTAASLAQQAARNFGSHAVGLLSRQSQSDPFSASLFGSIRGFYEALAQDSEPPTTLEQGAALVEACERAVRSVTGSLANAQVLPAASVG